MSPFSPVSTGLAIPYSDLAFGIGVYAVGLEVGFAMLFFPFSTDYTHTKESLRHLIILSLSLITNRQEVPCFLVQTLV